MQNDFRLDCLPGYLTISFLVALDPLLLIADHRSRRFKQTKLQLKTHLPHFWMKSVCVDRQRCCLCPFQYRNFQNPRSTVDGLIFAVT
jgi:hypothetical protein